MVTSPPFFRLNEAIAIQNRAFGEHELPLGYMDLSPGGEEYVCSGWLRESPGKLKAFNLCYGGLLGGGGVSGLRVADVGGGISHLTPNLIERGSYILVDPIHHLGDSEHALLERFRPNKWLWRDDWKQYGFRDTDLVIANDIFPNVDYRIGEFLDTLYFSSVSEVRLVVTLFYGNRSMTVSRLGSGELLTVIPLPTEEVVRLLQRFDPSQSYSDILLKPDYDSEWSNGRYMVFLRFRRNESLGEQ